MSEITPTQATEPKPKRVIIVSEANGRERRYLADELDHSAVGGFIEIFRDGHRIAGYPHGHWTGFRDDNAEAPGGTEAALRVAKGALNAIAGNEVGEHVCRRVASNALDEIFAETE